jgi:cytochrome P450
MLEHDPSLYRDPQVFNPERWLGDSDDACMARRSSVTFGTGSRTCLGQHLARHVLRKTTAALVYNFDMSFSSKIPDAIQGAKEFHSFPKKGSEGYLWLRLTPRFDNQ